MNAQKIPHNHRGGFALVSAVSVLALLVLIGLAVLSLSTSTTREAKVDRHTEIARANARMALAIAIGHLQEAMGPDQRVSATADILNNDAPGGVGQQGVVEGREKWLGVWRNTRTVNGIDYPVIGKRPDDDSGNAPYELAGVYSDLRSTDSTLQGGAWKTEMHLSWLVSGNEPDALAEGSVEMEELVSARNSVLDPSTGSTIPAVSVPKVSVEDGNYAYWISEENQKAPIHLTYRDPSASGIADFPHEQTNRVAHLSAAPTVDVSAIRGADGSQPFSDFPELSPESGNLEQDVRDVRKLVTVNTASLAGNNQGNSRIEDFIHDVSVHSQGMAIDPVLGSLKKDLTPLVSSGNLQNSVDFRAPSESVALQNFSSDFPIIPGFRHGFSGPKFGSLRHWAQMATPHGQPITAETAPIANAGSTIALRDNTGWSWSIEGNEDLPQWRAGHDGSADTRHLSDGAFTNDAEWASSGAKFHPVMTDARWHYFVTPNFTPPPGSASGFVPGLRFHMVPRVALWNPYNRPMQVPDMLVMMPNPFIQNTMLSELVFPESMRDRVRDAIEPRLGRDADGKDNPSITATVLPGTRDFKMLDLISKWRSRPSDEIGLDGTNAGRTGRTAKLELRTSSTQNRGAGDRGSADFPQDGLVPPTRWLAFVLEAQTLAPGQNAVYSPVSSGLRPISAAGAVGTSVEYNINNVLQNRLSAAVPQSEKNSFYHTYNAEYFGISYDTRRNTSPEYAQRDRLGNSRNNGNSLLTRNQARTDNWVTSGFGQNRATSLFVPYTYLAALTNFNFNEALEVTINGTSDENFPFMLKGINGSSSASVDTIVGTTSRSASTNFPTLQVMLHGNGGIVGTAVTRDAFTAGSSSTVGIANNSFRQFETLDIDNLRTPVSQVIGTKMLWLDESVNEGRGSTPFRSVLWSSPDSPASPVYKAFNSAPIADWNLRAGMIARSPSSPSGTINTNFGAGVRFNQGAGRASSAAYLRTNGAWALQVSPINPFDSGVQTPQLSSVNGLESKNPFVAAGDPGSRGDVVLFDIPDPEVGVLSLADFRHAPLSQRSHHPSYIIGNSKADIHSPRNNTAVAGWASTSAANAERFLANVLGNGNTGSGSVGPANVMPSKGFNEDRISFVSAYSHIYSKDASGSDMTFTSADGRRRPATEEIPYFDIAYETNQNLWDQFFVSGIPTRGQGSSSFVWNTTAPSLNQRHVFNTDSETKAEEVERQLNAGRQGLEWAFWNAAEVIKVEGQFNVNSTSVNAWRSFLGSNKQFAVELSDNTSVGQGIGKYSRFYKPRTTLAGEASLLSGTGWNSSRLITDQEIDVLAQFIVEEVKERGPFLSLADFINRRLDDGTNPHSRLGAVDSAIEKAQLNNGLENELGVVGVDPTDANHPDNNSFTNNRDVDQTSLASSRAFGFPGFLMQSDILSSIAPSLSVRGESFVIRTYGDSIENGVVRARAYLEAVIVRTPEYVDNENQPADAALLVNYANGELITGDLNEINRKFGRKFVVKTTRWLTGPDA